MNAVHLTIASASFAALDWAVLALYAALLVATGWWFTRNASDDTSDFFLGGRRMPVWAVTISVLATSLSAATFVGGPQQAYTGNLTYLVSNIGPLLGAVFAAFILIPRMYKLDLATPYGLLERRFGATGKRGASAAFLLGRVMASGARVYIVGIPAALIMFGEPETGEVIPAAHILVAIGAMTTVGIVYTLAGGVRSVIWTDVIQTAVFVFAVLAAMWVAIDRIPGGLTQAVETLRDAQLPDDTGSKLTLFDTSLDFSAPYALFTCCTAFVLLGIASYGLDQDMVQRMLTCKTKTRGAMSAVASTLVAIPVVALFMAVGLLLYIFYDRPDIMADAAPTYDVSESERIFLSFILNELPAGLTGLMMAGLFAAGLSSLNSGLNSMSSTVVNDFYRELRPGRDDKHYLAVGRVLVVIWGLVLGSFAGVCVYWQRSGEQTLIDFALGVMTFAYAGLLGVFFSALFTRRGSAASAVAALITGFLVIALLNAPIMKPVLSPILHHEALIWLEAHIWSLAFAWKLAIGTLAAFAVCQLGSPKRQSAPTA